MQLFSVNERWHLNQAHRYGFSCDGYVAARIPADNSDAQLVHQASITRRW